MKNPEKQIDTDEGDREQRANGLLRFLNFAKNIEPLEGRSFEEAFDTEEHKREFISSLDAEGFIALLNGLNGILRDKDKKDWAMDGKFVGVKGNFFLSPFLEDKPELIGQVLSAMQRMNSEGKSLDDIAVLVASCINAIHPYANGNGRTSRFVYTVIANNEKQLTENQREKVLLDSGRDLIDVNPASVQNKILNIVSNNAGLNDKEVNPNNLQRIFAHKLELNDKIPEEEKDILSILFKGDRQRLFLALFEFLKGNPNTDNYIKDKKDKGFDFSSIDINKLLADLSKEEIEKIIEIYRRIKVEEVKILIDCIENPEKPEYKKEYDGKQMSLKEIIEDNIDRVEIMRRVDENMKKMIERQIQLDKK